MGDIVRDAPLEGVCRLTLNRPEALNSLSFAMYAELIDHLEAVRYDHDVRVVLLTGAGRAFCAGHDTRAGGEPDWVDQGLGKAQWQRRVLDKLGQIPVLMHALPQPVICAVNGAAAGAGYALALLEMSGYAPRPLRRFTVVPAYLVMSNAAFAIATFRFLRGDTMATWRPRAG